MLTNIRNRPLSLRATVLRGALHQAWAEMPNAARADVILGDSKNFGY